MAIETFDQRFKRLTGDMLMLDICRILGIEVRDLMKIRSGVRIPLSRERLRHLCLDQSVDYDLFVRDIDEPWSSERITPVITMDTPAPKPSTPRTRSAGTRSGPRFRADGSRILESESTETSSMTTTRQTEVGEIAAPPQTTTEIASATPRMTRLSRIPIVRGESQGHESKNPVGVLFEKLRNTASATLVHINAQTKVPSIKYQEPEKANALSPLGSDQHTLRELLSDLRSFQEEVGHLSARLERFLT